MYVCTYVLYNVCMYVLYNVCMYVLYNVCMYVSFMIMWYALAQGFTNNSDILVTVQPPPSVNVPFCVLYYMSVSHCPPQPQISFSAMEEDIVAALADKNPSVKAETALFLARCFQQCTPALMPKPLLKSYCPPLIQVCVCGGGGGHFYICIFVIEPTSL